MLAELKAIEMAQGHCQNNPVARDKINIFTDSLCELQALQKLPPPDNLELVNKILSLIQALNHHDIHFHWIPPHAGVYYDEIADRTAERAKQTGEPTHIQPSRSSFRNDIVKAIKNELATHIALVQTL